MAKITGLAARSILAAITVIVSVAPVAAASFGNRTVSLNWADDGHLSAMHLVDRLNARTIAVTAAFAIHLADGRVLTPADFSMQGEPRLDTMAGVAGSPRLAERKQRSELKARFVDQGGRFRVDLRLIQVDDAAYLRVEATITALKQDEDVRRIDLLDAEAEGAEVLGRVAGSPVVVGPDYLQFENPLSKSSVEVDHPAITLWIDRALPLGKGKSVSYSVAVGVSRPGQLRRDFQAYLEDQRAHPYRPFLHYNSWYDIGYFNPYTSSEAVDRIEAFCHELSLKRGVKIDSFLFDDGWDDRKGNWAFSKSFPDGFLPVRDAAAKCGAAPGIWLSPWGGYGKPKVERVKSAGGSYETMDGGFALSGPKYYRRFREVALDLIERQGVNQFKFDGTGNADRVISGSAFDSDFDAALTLIRDLRLAKPDLFINLTTGTYPSPAWLRDADTIWRGGQDHDFAGVGPARERWITYRDAQVYQTDVIGGPLFPLNSLMLHGIIYAEHAVGLNSDPQGDFANEVHSYFASGTELQELYVTPTLLTPQDWDVLAQAARWSRANAEVLKDTHWIGGNPEHLDAYGWAAWSVEKSIVTIRNPDARSQSFLLDLDRALELPAGSPDRYSAKAIWSGGARIPATLHARAATTIQLRPFEVVTIELTPRVR